MSRPASKPVAADEEEGRAAFAGGLLRRLLALALPQRGLLLLALLLFPLVAATQLVQPLLLKHAIDGPIQARDLPGLTPLALAYLGLVLLQAALQFAQTVVMQLAGQRVMRDIRERLFRRVLTLAPSFFDRTPLGKILTRLTSDVEALNEFLSSGLVSVIADSVLLVGIAVAMLLLDVRLALASFALVPPLVLGVGWLRGALRQSFRAVRNRNTALNAWLQERIAGMTIVQAFCREPLDRQAHAGLARAWCEESLRSLWLSSLLSTFVQLAQNLTLALLIWAALGDWLGAGVTVGLVVAFVDYVERLYAPVENLSGRFAILQTALAAAEKIFALLDEPDALPEPADPLPCGPLERAISLQGVGFRYQVGDPVLRGVDLTVPRGATVALVGATGAGKSTIVKLLARFYDPQEGAVTWDGTDVRRFRTLDLRRRIAYVPQETFLFSDTLERNVALDPGAVDDEAVRRAATAVTADRVAADLPQGWQQVLGERGHDLSAGERQLISFARALARDPDLLVLDEATAHVDGETEARIQEALQRLLRGRTAVVIAHRLSTIKQADKIVVLHKGQVREVGTHAELLARRGLYWTLYRLQSEEAA